jgi:hypothetical protein
MDRLLAKGFETASMIIIDEKPLNLNRWDGPRRRGRHLSREAAGGGAHVDTTRK